MDWVINDELNLKVSHVVGWAAAAAMVIGGIVPYVPQYRQIKKTQEADGFSLVVCLTLLMANSLRILFWFSSRFELPLLVQSIVMNITMFLMIHLCVKVKRNNAIMKSRDRVFTGDGTTDAAKNQDDSPRIEGNGDTTPSHAADSTSSARSKRGADKHYLIDFDLKYFWAWTDFQSYLDFMLVVWLVGAIITYFMLPYLWFMETMGFVAVFTEAMLGAPQFIRNFNNKSTHGMSIHMVIMWTVGDMFKTGYFIFRHAPTQFWVCGTLQVSLDLAILLQVFFYRKNTEPRSSHRGD